MSLNHLNTFKLFEDQIMRNFPREYNYEPKEPTYTPAVNTLEVEEAYLLDVDLPGVAKGSIKIDVKDNELTITGERALKAEKKSKDYYKLETKYGKFSRAFTLPEDADAENIEAKNENGVLSLFIPKLEEVDNHYSIEIK